MPYFLENSGSPLGYEGKFLSDILRTGHFHLCHLRGSHPIHTEDFHDAHFERFACGRR